MRWNTTHPSTLWAILLLQLSYCKVRNLEVSQTVHLFFCPYSCLFSQPWMGSRRILKGARCSIRWIGGHFAKRGARSRWMWLLSEEDVDCSWWWTKAVDQDGGPKWWTKMVDPRAKCTKWLAGLDKDGCYSSSSNKIREIFGVLQVSKIIDLKILFTFATLSWMT